MHCGPDICTAGLSVMITPGPQAIGQLYTMMRGQIKSGLGGSKFLHIHPAAPLVQQRSRLQCYHNKAGC